jgi:hypothetical protein
MSIRPFQFSKLDTLDDVIGAIRSIASERLFDVQEFNGLQQRLEGVRKVDKIPATSADVVVATDRLGDINLVAGNVYVLVDDAGTIKWQTSQLVDF